MQRGAIIKHDIKNAPKTGNWRYMKPEVDEQKCIGCQTCVSYCPEACIEMRKRNKQQVTNNKQQSEKGLATIDFEFCKGCGVCAQVCPLKAILMRK